MKTRIRKRMRLFLLEKEDIFQIKLFLLMANLSRLSLGISVSLSKYLIHTLVERRRQAKKSTTMEIFHSFVPGK